MISLNGPKPKLFAGVLAAICLIAGVYLTFFHSQGFVKTTATIVEIEEDHTGESTSYSATVEYTVNGKAYTARLDQSSASYRVGKTVPVFYDPNDPSVVHAGSSLGLILMIVSTAVFALVVIAAIREKKGQRQDKRSPGGAAGQ